MVARLIAAFLFFSISAHARIQRIYQVHADWDKISVVSTKITANVDGRLFSLFYPIDAAGEKLNWQQSQVLALMIEHALNTAQITLAQLESRIFQIHKKLWPQLTFQQVAEILAFSQPSVARASARGNDIYVIQTPTTQNPRGSVTLIAEQVPADEREILLAMIDVALDQPEVSLPELARFIARAQAQPRRGDGSPDTTVAAALSALLPERSQNLDDPYYRVVVQPLTVMVAETPTRGSLHGHYGSLLVPRSQQRILGDAEVLAAQAELVLNNRDGHPRVALNQLRSLIAGAEARPFQVPFVAPDFFCQFLLSSP